MTVREDLVAAVIAALAAGDATGYELDDLAKMATEGVRPADYVEVHLSTRTPGAPRLGAGARVFGWRLQPRVVASSMTNANRLLDRVHDALYDRCLVVDGRRSTPLVAVPGPPPEPDDGAYTALAEYTFVY